MFGSLAAILTPFVDHRIHEVTMTTASLGDLEAKWQEKGVVRPVTVIHPGNGCVQGLMTAAIPSEFCLQVCGEAHH